MSRFHEVEGRRDWWRGLSGPKKALIAIGGAVVAVGLAALFGFVFMWLWNGLMPRIFKLPEIGYWEGWGLVILSSILFKGGSHGHSFSAEHRRKRFLRERMRSESAEGGIDGTAEAMKS
jgi:high-affinity Fe2+/Pb2+ permease